MALVTTSTGACLATPTCTAYGLGAYTYWAPKVYSETKKTGTVVVVQIINTVSNTTRISTVAKNVPPGFVPPPTNFEGTRTAKATYEHHGSNLTTAFYDTLLLPRCISRYRDEIVLTVSWQSVSYSPP